MTPDTKQKEEAGLARGYNNMKVEWAAQILTTNTTIIGTNSPAVSIPETVEASTRRTKVQYLLDDFLLQKQTSTVCYEYSK